MADINRATIETIERRFEGIWTSAFNAPVSNDFIALATQYSSIGASNDYGFLEQLGGWREWVGGRRFDDLKSNSFNVKNRTFEDSITMPRETIEDDAVGLYDPLVAQMGEGYQQLVVELLMDQLINNYNAYDGNPLFDTDRTYGSNTINNATSAVFSSTTFETAMIAMQSYKFHGDSDVIGVSKPGLVSPNLLIVGPNYQKTAWDVLVNQFIASSNATVQNYNSTRGVGYIVSPWLTGSYADLWFLADTTKVIRPLLLQLRTAPEFMISDADYVMRTNTLDYMARARLAAGPQAPHLIYGGGRADL